MPAARPVARVSGAAALGRCAVCDGMSSHVVWRENGYEGRACACGTVYTTPPPALDAVDPTADAHPDSYYAAPAPRRVRWLQRHHAGRRLLEIGCGEGHFLAAAQAEGYRVVGIEPEPGRARRAAARLDASVECALLESCRVRPAQFDVVYHCDLLSHFADPVAALRKMTAFLAPGGVLAFEVGLLGGIAPWWYTMAGSIGYPQHRWLFSVASLRRLLGRADLELGPTAHFGLAPEALFRGAMRGLARRYRDLRAAAHLRPATRVTASRVLDQTESFWRYTVGQLAPPVGPATLFAIAHPRRAGRWR
jgi:SAM-dependent methyltransferase